MSNIDFSNFSRNDVAMFFRGVSADNLSREDSVRLEVSMAWIETHYHGDGLTGCLRELWAHTEHSAKKAVATQGKVDAFFNAYNAEGKVAHLQAEIKTTGGRVAAMFDIGKDGKPLAKMSVPAGYVVYSLYSEKVDRKKQKNGTIKEYRNVKILTPRIMSVQRFMQICVDNKILRVIADSRYNKAEVAIAASKPAAVVKAFENELEYNPLHTYKFGEIR